MSTLSRPVLSPAALAARLDGLLSFPVTPFDPAGRLDLELLAEHVRQQIEAGPAAVFVCCGTGEFFSLDVEEYASAVATAVQVAAGRLPVLAGTGYGTALAGRFAGLAEAAGADGLLVLPPYLVRPPQRGLLAHYRAIAAATRLGVIVYQRDNVTLTPQTLAELAALPNLVGVKDGLGDLDLVQRLISVTRDDGRLTARGSDGPPLLFFNGLPTAEMSSLAYRGQGVTAYSSAVFCFAPEVATGFHRALRDGDSHRVDLLLDQFYRPLVELRLKGEGYAVSLVKAGVRLRGLDVGTVRPPLTEPAVEHVAELEKLIHRGLALVGAEPS